MKYNIIVILALFLVTFSLMGNAQTNALPPELEKIAGYAQQYEQGEINYLQLQMLIKIGREELFKKIENQSVWVPSKKNEEEPEQVPEQEYGPRGWTLEAVKTALGEPDYYDNWIWIENLQESRRVQEKLPRWEKEIWNGEKIRITINGWPHANLINNELIHYYWIDSEVKFKQPEDQLTKDEIVVMAKQALQEYKNGTIPLTEFARKAVDLEKKIGMYYESHKNNCEKTLEAFFESPPSIQERVQWNGILYSGTNMEAYFKLDEHQNQQFRGMHTWIELRPLNEKMKMANLGGEAKSFKYELENKQPQEIITEYRQRIGQLKAQMNAIDASNGAAFNPQVIENLQWVQDASDVLSGKANQQESGYNPDQMYQDMYEIFKENTTEFSKNTMIDHRFGIKLLQETKQVTSNYCEGNETECGQDNVCISNGVCQNAKGGNETCDNQQDDDQDTLKDCEDPDCIDFLACGRKCESVCSGENSCWDCQGKNCQNENNACGQCNEQNKNNPQACESVCQIAGECNEQKCGEDVCGTCRECEDEYYGGGCRSECKECSTCINALPGREDPTGQCAEYCKPCNVCNYEKGHMQCPQEAPFNYENGGCQEPQEQPNESQLPEKQTGQEQSSETNAKTICEESCRPCTACYNQSDVKVDPAQCRESCTPCDVCYTEQGKMPCPTNVGFDYSIGECMQSTQSPSTDQPQEAMPTTEPPRDANNPPSTQEQIIKTQGIGMKQNRITGLVVQGMPIETKEEQQLKCGEMTCNARQVCNTEKGWCECAAGFFECDGDWLNGCESEQQCNQCTQDSDCAPPRCSEDKRRIATFNCKQGESHTEDIAIVELGGSCEYLTSGEVQGGIWLDAHGEGFEGFNALKQELHMQENTEYCKRDLDSYVQERLELQKSLNDEFLKWFYDTAINDSLNEFEKHIRTIGSVYESFVRVNGDIARSMACLDLKQLPEGIQPIQKATLKLETGDIEIWEEIKQTNFYSGRTVEVISPYMKEWIFPTRAQFKAEFKQKFREETPEGPTPEELKEMREDKKAMELIQRVSNNFGGDAKIVIELRDESEVIIRGLLSVNPTDLVQFQEITEKPEDTDVTIGINLDFMYGIISSMIKDMEGSHIQTPYWEPQNMPFRPDEAINGFIIFGKIIGGIFTGQVAVDPITQYPAVIFTINEIFTLMPK